MKTPATDYIAAATAVAVDAAPAETAPVVAAAPVESAPVVDVAPVEGAPVVVDPAKPAAPPASKLQAQVAKGLEDVAREKVALRAEREKLKADTGQSERARAMLEAAERGDALGLMAAAKIPWSRAAQQVLEGNVPPEKPTGEKPDPRDERLAALEREISQSKAASIRSNITSQMSARVSADPAKFKFVGAFKAEGEAVRYIEDYFKQTGELPGSDINESMEIALEAVEAHFAKEAKRWEPVLTPSTSVATVPSSKAAVPAGATSKQAGKTLTNQVGAGPGKAPTDSPREAKSSDDYIAAALALVTQ